MDNKHALDCKCGSCQAEFAAIKKDSGQNNFSTIFYLLSYKGFERESIFHFKYKFPRSNRYISVKVLNEYQIAVDFNGKNEVLHTPFELINGLCQFKSVRTP